MANDAILWRRLDQEGHESARLYERESGLTLIGTALFSHEQQPCRLNYDVRCDANGQTVAGTILGWVGDETIEIEIVVDAARRWQLNGKACSEVEGCLDLDLNFSPSTNLLPIRRLQLRIGQSHPVRAAWLRFPSFRLEPLEQSYRRISDSVYRYQSGDGSFVRDLTVNEVGFVITYPDFWQQVA